MNCEGTDWDNERTKLKIAFSKGEILGAKIRELERYLVVLANTPYSGNPSPASSEEIRHKSETETYSDIIRHLLMIRLGERLHAKSHRLAFWAFIASIVAILISIIALKGIS